MPGLPQCRHLPRPSPPPRLRLAGRGCRGSTAPSCCRSRSRACSASSIGLAGLGGVDDAAHRYQASVFSVDGWTAWDNYWYAGRYGVINYSLLFYPLASVLGVVAVAVLAVTASSGLFAVIVMHQWGRPARWSALLFSLSAPALLAAGQYPFALGTAFSLLALLAAQRGRPWLLVAAALATALSSPLAFAFLVVTLGGLLLGGGRTSALRSARVAFPLCAIMLILAAEVAVYQAFPGGGPFPYPAADLIGITAFALVGLVLARGSQLTRPLGGLFLAYLVIAWCAKLFPSPLGGNATRLLDYAIAPMLALVIAVRGGQARALGALALSVAIAWQAAPFVQNVANSFGEQAQAASYWQPVINFLHQPGRHDPANFRVEIVSTARHYESYYLTRGEGEAIPRGWYRQNDFPTNGVLYDRDAQRRRLRALAAADGSPLRLPAERRARRVREGRGGAPAQRAQRAARGADLEGLPRVRAAECHAAPDARHRPAGRRRAGGRRARAARDARAVLALAAGRRHLPPARPLLALLARRRSIRGVCRAGPARHDTAARGRPRTSPSAY